MFDLVLCDIWGPYQSPTHAGCKFLLTIVDDFSRYTWVFLMHSKSDALKIVSQFFKLVETQYATCIKNFRFDNASELAFIEFFQSKGVIHQFSCVACPEQNSVVEHKHQHLLNFAHALLFQSRVPIQFWGECVLALLFWINRSPPHILKWQTTFFKLNGTNTNYGLLHTFGCLCFASTLSSQRSKFHPRAIPSVFVGYPPGIKRYKLYDIEQKRFFISRDVIFLENVFPFHQITLTEEVIDPFPDIVLPTSFDFSRIKSDSSTANGIVVLIDDAHNEEHTDANEQPDDVVPIVHSITTDGVNTNASDIGQPIESNVIPSSG